MPSDDRRESVMKRYYTTTISLLSTYQFYLLYWELDLEKLTHHHHLEVEPPLISDDFAMQRKEKKGGRIISQDKIQLLLNSSTH